MALGMMAMGLAIAGRSGDALQALDWLPVTDFGPTHLDAAAARGTILTWADRLDDARIDFRRLLAAAPRCGSFQLHTSVLALLGEVEHRAGNWDDAVAFGEEAVEHAKDTDQLWGLGPAHALVSHTYSRRGDWSAAARHVDEARRQSQALPGNMTGAAYAADAALLLAHSRNDWEGVVTASEPLLKMFALDAVNEPGIFVWKELYCEALIRLRRFDEAEAALVPYERVASARTRESAMGAAARVRGMLHAHRGQHAAADDDFREAIAHSEAMGMPFERALAHFQRGCALRRTGRRKMAIEQLTAASHTFAHLRAEPFVARADQELRGCGQTRSGTAQRDTPELTPQERSVATLVGSGMTNREAATQLVVSVKTVEYHLTHIFTKLRVTSRSQLAGRMNSALGIDTDHGRRGPGPSERGD